MVLSPLKIYLNKLSLIVTAKKVTLLHVINVI